MSDKTTIIDVAKAAKVSPSTVSNLLNGRDERMRPETKDRILATIAELGYQPNQVARQLKTGHSPIIGLIVPSVATPFYGLFARHIEESALKRGYQVLFGNSGRDPKRERSYAGELWGYGVRGIIFGSSLINFSHLHDLIQRGLHVVAFDRPTQQSDQFIIDSISVDNARAARIATKHLIALGHTDIAFLSGPIRTVSRLDRLEGYRSALIDAGIEPNPDYVWDQTTESGFGDAEAVEIARQSSQELLSLSKPPTAIFAVNDLYAFGAYAGARDLGLHIPQDVSIVGFDDIALTEVVQPPLTTIRQPMREIAHAAVERLIGRLEDSYEEPEGHIVVPPKLIVRASTAEKATS